MNSPSIPLATASAKSAPAARVDYLDATRAFALLLGIVFHASLSFLPVFIGWAVQDVNTSRTALLFFTLSHSFRMGLFFLISGYFAHLMFHRKGAGEFIRSRALRLAIPFVVGWFILHPLLVSGWSIGAASMQGPYHFLSGLAEGFRSFKTLPTGLFTQTHLWFLYYLALATGATLLLRGAVRASGQSKRVAKSTDAAMRWFARSTFARFALALPIAAVLWRMRMWGMDTPDQSMAPDLNVLAIYSGWFAFGWLLHRQPDSAADFSRITWSRVALAIVASGATIGLTHFQMDPGDPNYAHAHVAYVFAYALTMISLISLVLGTFRACCKKERPWVRYIADASYWLYLVHLPLVVWLQVLVAEWNLPCLIKLLLITGATIGLGIAAYDLVVRSTFVGAVLNGRRRERVLLPAMLSALRSPRARVTPQAAAQS